MSSKRKRIIIWVANVVTLAAIGGYYYAQAGDPLSKEYPDAPYSPVGDDFPRIITIAEAPPSSDKAAYKAYWDGRRAVDRWALEKGALSKATPEEQEAYRLAIDEEDYVAARELVVKILNDNPASIPGRFALATIEHEGEVNFPRAIFLMRKLRHELHEAGLADPDDPINREWYIRVCYAEWNILDDLKRDEEAVRVVALLEQVYQPVPFLRDWQLMRLGRFDEAQQAVEEEKALGRPQRAANTAVVLAGEKGLRAEAYEIGKAGSEDAAESAVFWSNFSGVCTEDFRFDEAEEALLKSASLRVNFRGSPYTYLAGRFAGKGQFNEAWDSLKKAQSQRLERDAYTLVMDQHTFDRNAAFVLFLLGNAGDSYRLVRRAVERPSRDYSGYDERDARFSLQFYYLVMLKNYIHQLKESGDAAGQAALDVDLWTLKRQIVADLRDDDYLVNVMRPHMPGVPSPSTLFLPDLARLLPSGVARTALSSARAAEEHPQAVPYFDAVEAELNWAAGDYAQALPLAQQALEGLNNDHERCLRARVAVVAGDCHRKLNQMDEALPFFEQALRECPAVYRLVDVAIPITIAEDGSPLAVEWAAALLDSPRFEGHPNGFVLITRSGEDQLTFELFRSGDNRHCDGAVPTKGSSARVLSAATRRLMSRMCSPRLDLTATDINSLDNGLFSTPKSGDTEKLLKLATPGA